MTRTVAREIAVHFAFELGFFHEDPQAYLDRRLTPEVFASLAEEAPLYQEFPNKKQADYIRRVALGVAEHAAELDAYIDRYAKGWRFARISRVAAAVMRVCMFELLYLPEVPPAAAIHAAVELSKGYEPPEVTSFINGILGAFWREEGAAVGALSAGPASAQKPADTPQNETAPKPPEPAELPEPEAEAEPLRGGEAAGEADAAAADVS